MTHLFVAFSAEDNERGKGGKCEGKDENEAEEEPQTGVEVSEEENFYFPEIRIVAAEGERTHLAHQ